MLRLPNFVPLFFVLSATSLAGQIAKKTPILDTNTIVQRNAELAENGHCVEALPELKKNAPHVPDKELKRRAGLDGVHCAMTLNRPEEALDFLQFLAHEFPRDPEVLYVATHAYSDLSIRASQELVHAAPSSYQVHELNAESFEMQGKWNEAAQEYRKVLKENPRLPGIHFRLGRLLLSKPDPSASEAEEAKKEFQEELKLDPKNAGAEYVLGELARQAGEWPEAIEHFSKATKLDSGFSEAFLGLGTSLLSAKQFAEAIPPLETAAKLQPENPTAHYQLSIAYGRTGRKQDAEREAVLHRQTAEKANEANKAVETGTPGTAPRETPK
jgi:tetratricopeptide (TPR) repeat protein